MHATKPRSAFMCVSWLTCRIIHQSPRLQNAKLTNGFHRVRGHVHKSRGAAARAAAQKSNALAAAGGATGGVNGGGGENFAFQVKHMSHCHLSDTVILNLIT